MNKTKKAIERLYIGTCDIYEYGKVKDPKTKRTESKELKVNGSPIKCRASYSSIPSTNQQEGGKMYQAVKLFINPDLDIKPNSKIVITQNGRTTEYKNSGTAAVYSSHQEINLELFKEWA